MNDRIDNLATDLRLSKQRTRDYFDNKLDAQKQENDARMVDDGVLEPEKESSECRLEWLHLEYDDVEGGRFTNKVRISSILASFSCL